MGAHPCSLGQPSKNAFCSAVFRHGCEQVAEVGEERRRKNQPREGRHTPKPGDLANAGEMGQSLFKHTFNFENSSQFDLNEIDLNSNSSHSISA